MSYVVLAWIITYARSRTRRGHRDGAHDLKYQPPYLPVLRVVAVGGLRTKLRALPRVRRRSRRRSPGIFAPDRRPARTLWPARLRVRSPRDAPPPGQRLPLPSLRF